MYVVEPRGGIQPNVSRFHFFAHDLSMHLTFGGHIDHGIIEQRRVATEASAVFEGTFTLDEFGFSGAERGEVIDV